MIVGLAFLFLWYNVGLQLHDQENKCGSWDSTSGEPLIQSLHGVGPILGFLPKDGETQRADRQTGGLGAVHCYQREPISGACLSSTYLRH